MIMPRKSQQKCMFINSASTLKINNTRKKKIVEGYLTENLSCGFYFSKYSILNY
jgi:hypothetical protein